ncbi:hypothetical protein Golax_017147, partial [Gossypium laxum]|nr:hypothetical protein [Gossypium laxum]
VCWLLSSDRSFWHFGGLVLFLRAGSFDRLFVAGAAPVNKPLLDFIGHEAWAVG